MGGGADARETPGGALLSGCRRAVRVVQGRACDARAPRLRSGTSAPALPLTARGARTRRYTGHVHMQRATFGNTFSNATKVALQCPPDSPEPLTHFDMSKGQRTMETTGFALAGTGFTAAAKHVEATKNSRVYVQGSKVDLGEYYKTLENCNYEQILIKSGSSKKARSYVNLGDNYYYSGQHVWETTYMESYEEEPRLMAVQTEQGKAALLSSADAPAGAEEEGDVEEAKFRYRCIQAAVGQKRLDDLEEQIRAKVC